MTYMTDANTGPAFLGAAKILDGVLQGRGLLPHCAKQLSRLLEEAVLLTS